MMDAPIRSSKQAEPKYSHGDSTAFKVLPKRTVGKMPWKKGIRLGSCSRLLRAMRPISSERSWYSVFRKIREDDVVASSVKTTYCTRHRTLMLSDSYCPFSIPRILVLHLAMTAMLCGN